MSAIRSTQTAPESLSCLRGRGRGEGHLAMRSLAAPTAQPLIPIFSRKREKIGMSMPRRARA